MAKFSGYSEADAGVLSAVLDDVHPGDRVVVNGGVLYIGETGTYLGLGNVGGKVVGLVKLDKGSLYHDQLHYLSKIV